MQKRMQERQTKQKNLKALWDGANLLTLKNGRLKKYLHIAASTENGLLVPNRNHLPAEEKTVNR